MSNCQGCPDTQITFGKNRTVETSHPLFRVFCVGANGEPSFGELKLSIPPGYERIDINLDGVIEYKKDLDDWESPRPIDGYLRDSENPFIFRPQWVPCKSRLYSILVKDQCQCIDVIAECIHTPSKDNKHRYVRYEDCEKCTCLRPYQRPKPQKKTVSSLRVPNLRHSSK